MTYLRNIRIYLIVIVSGILLSLPFSYPSLYIVSWIGLIPFLYVIKELKENRINYWNIFVLGTVLGTTIILSSAAWLYYPLIDFSGMPWFLSVFVFILVFILFGFIYGIWSLLYIYIRQKEGVSPFWLAISWTAVEYLRFTLIPALPFGFIAYTQGQFSSLVQLAEYGGFYLITFIVLLINGYIYKLFLKKKIKYGIPLFIIFILITTHGMIRINNYNNKDYQAIKVGIVQTNLTPEEKWKFENIKPNMDYLISESRTILAEEPLFILWPESALTFDMVRNEYYREKFMEKLSDVDTYIQIGSLAIIDKNNEKYNSSFLISPDNNIKNRYNKNKLVPFGEYMPLADIVETLTGLSMVSEIPGNEITKFQISEVRWKTVICSELLYPQLTAEKINNVDFVVNQSNEAWYRKGNLQKQMWASAIFRAVENRRTVVRSGNKAYGGAVSPAGLPIVRNHSRDDTSFIVQIPLNKETTLYHRWGDYTGYISVMIVLLLFFIKIVIIIYRKKKGF
ncbi:MAG: apolipoprotein N-acyltransferase [Bacillota bacterium]